MTIITRKLFPAYLKISEKFKFLERLSASKQKKLDQTRWLNKKDRGKISIARKANLGSKKETNRGLRSSNFAEGHRVSRVY